MDFSAIFFTKRDLQQRFPVKAFFSIIAVWILLIILNFLSLKFWKFTGCDLLFPFSVLYPSNFLWTGFLAGSAFLFLGIYSFKNSEKFSVPVVFLLCFLLVLMGNLAQGNLDIAFEQPFYLKGRQYYRDALPIKNPCEWLRNFTKNQDTFQLHTRTHPPFVVLLHYWILKIFGGNILALGIVFFLISALFFPILNSILKNLDFSDERRKQTLLLSAVIPSVNIYMLVSIDGIILMTSSLLILGITRIFKLNKIDIWSILFCTLSLIFTNMLSFSGLFLMAFFGLFCLWFLIKKNIKFAIVGTISVVAYLLFFLAIFKVFGYNQLETFQKASASENPGGFMLLYDAYIYFWTRFQAIGEILIFLSFGFFAVLFSKKFSFNLKYENFIKILFSSAVSALGLMLVSGAYGTGETARACLFIVPFFIILLKNLNQKTFDIVCILALLQCFGMQIIGNFFW